MRTIKCRISFYVISGNVQLIYFIEFRLNRDLGRDLFYKQEIISNELLNATIFSNKSRYSLNYMKILYDKCLFLARIYLKINPHT